jgi:dTDP-4-dehydrorhamnose reductase
MISFTSGAADQLGLPELWAGPECTVNRIGAGFRDQFVETGHAGRIDDLDLLAGLGLTKVRYPLLWERTAPHDPMQQDWTWSDQRMARLRKLNIGVIAGLLHHGSGPAYTNLLDPGLAQGLAVHADAAARRYPWIDDWTPVNEPLTTSRFSALYGCWYPHKQDEPAFWLALLNQIDATRLAMRAIRSHNPRARLIQTEDLGRTYATAQLGEQAAFDNTRRWMTFDLLCGSVVPGHDLWRRLAELGFADRLRTIADDPCPPDIIGINHYLTSDRFLDHRIRRYPHCAPGGNGLRRYVDTEAIRVLTPPPAGLTGALQEAWQRYGRPIAITEVHNGSTREEQMRWMTAAWRSALQACQAVIDLRAVTCWAIFGNSGWDTLLTAPGRYEPGAYDVSSGLPRPTAMVPLLQALAKGHELSHPVLEGSGWWQRGIRLHHPEIARAAPMQEQQRFGENAKASASPLLIVGASGTLGQALAASCRHRDIAYVLTQRADMDLADAQSIAATLDRHRPWAVINAAGWVRVDDAESQPAACLEANAVGAERLAAECAKRGIATASFSSDLVFDGQRTSPYDEEQIPSPLNTYGRSKVIAEQAIASLPGRHLMVRTAAFFSPFDDHNFAVHACASLMRGEPFAATDDQTITPTYVPDLCNAVLDLVIDGETGIWHLTNEDACTWAEFATRLADAAGLDAGLIEYRSGASFNTPAKRPAYVPLISGRGKLLPSLDHAIARFVDELAGSARYQPDQQSVCASA